MSKHAKNGHKGLDPGIAASSYFNTYNEYNCIILQNFILLG